MAKRKTQARREQNNLVNISDARLTRIRKREVTLIPRNTKQEEYLRYLEDDANKIIIAAGSAGTGKTMFAVTKAIQELQNGKVDRIVITRPAVSVEGENHGYLPGDINQKMEPWLMPILDVFYEYYSKRDVASMVEEGIIETAPMMYMRGRNLNNSFVILDEAQNTTKQQIKMIMTRIGEGSRIVITGDEGQSDQGMQGLSDVLWLIRQKNLDGIKLVQFKKQHVERSETAKLALSLFED